jgi:hypothetical protein
MVTNIVFGGIRQMNMIKFITETGSVYEVDTENKAIRRLKGKHDPTTRQGKDSEWRSYISITPISKGRRCIIFWNSDTTPLFPESNGFGTPVTMTSQIVDIIENSNADKILWNKNYD